MSKNTKNKEEREEKNQPGKSILLVTYGCQMNEYDSELARSIIAGAGLASVRRLRIFSFLHRPEAMLDNIVVGILSVALIGATLATVLPGHHEIPYYHMINEQDYEEFVWIEDNVGDDYKKALLDPWKATPFSAITGKNIYTRIHGGPKPIDFEAQNYLNDGCKDTTFLTENGISVIYNPEPCSNPDLTKVRESVYLLK